MAFKMKGMSFGNSPMKQNKFNRPPEDFDWKASKKRAKETFQKFGAKKGHGTIEDLKARDNFNKRQASKSTAKDFVKNLKIKDTPKQLAKGAKKGVIDKVTGKTITNFPKDKSLKKFAKKALKVGGRSLGLASLGVMAYDAYKSGQKHSGGKINPNQKSIMSEGKKKTKSIFNKKK